MSKLNKQQAEAVEYGEGPLLVVAGAGTGKTTVIVERFRHLVSQGIAAQNILAITFTEKATNEMRERIAEVVPGSYAIDLNIFTFNAFGHELLSEFGPEVGLGSDHQLINESGVVVLLREHLDELGLDYFAPISQPDSQLATIAEYFSRLKQQLVKPKTYTAFANSMKASTDEEKLEKAKHTELARAYGQYEKIARARNVVDYDDQIFLAVQLLEARSNLAAQLGERFKYVLVDEFQDTNPMQSRLIELVAKQDGNLSVVGDDDQSIYGWRGATLANILNFSKIWPNTKQVALIENYRSTQIILDHAYALIQHNNPERLESISGLNKRLQANVDDKTPVQLENFAHIDGELDWIAQDISKRLKAGEDPGSIAVLARRNNGAQRVSEMLTYYEINHSLAGIKTDMYQNPVVGTMLETLKAVVDTSDNQAVYHSLTSALFNLDQQTLAQLAAKVRRENESLLEALAASKTKSFQAAAKQLKGWSSRAGTQQVGELSYRILDESGWKQELYTAAEESESDRAAVQALGQWFNSLREFTRVAPIASAASYLENLPALQASGELLEMEAFVDDTLPAVMSVHKAKGLEWQTVYIADCTEQSFPLRANSRSLRVPDDLAKTTPADDHMAEERRLMYVAMTRAKQNLILTYSDSHTGSTKRKPSRFLHEIFGDELSVATSHTGLSTQHQIKLQHEETTVQLPNTMISGDNLVLSTSQANDFLHSPRDFYYRHILNVPDELSPSAEVGLLMHSLIQDVNRARMNHETPPSLQQLSQRLHEQWPREGYLSKHQRERAEEEMLAAFKIWYKRQENEPLPHAVEQSFRIHVPGTKLLLTGRIDAAFMGEGGVEIIDYKTSTSANTAKKAKSRTTASKQLEMYALAWRELHGEAPSQVSLDFIATGEKGSVAKRPATLEKLAGTLHTVELAIRNYEFELGKEPTPYGDRTA